MHGAGWVIWALNNSIGNNGSALHNVFTKTAVVSLLAPIIDMALTFYAYNSYYDCSEVNVDRFDGTNAHQKVSCKGGSDSEYGTSGTIVKGITSDPYMTWLAATMSSATVGLAVYGMTLPAILKGYRQTQTCVDSDGNEVPCADVPEANSAAEKKEKIKEDEKKIQEDE